MLNIFRAGFSGLCAVAVCALSVSAAPTVSEVDTAVEAVMAKSGGVGSIVAVLQNGEPVMIRAYGLADIEHSVPVKRETVFQSGSVGKMFTATAVMLLKNEGKLSLEDKLIHYFPEGPDYWERVTIRQMLSHRGGLARLYGPSSAEIFTLSKDYSDDDLVKVIGSLPMEFEPGSKYQYSNSAYVLLGILVKKVSGQFYGDYLKEKLFTPIGMENTRVNEPAEVILNRAEGYEDEDGKPVRAEYVSRSLSRTADGSLLFTIDDLINWDKALTKASFLPRDQLAEMFASAPYADGTVGAVQYGYGWASHDMRGHKVVDHSGYWQGFSTYLARYVEDGFTVAVLTNSINGNPRGIAVAVAALLNPEYAVYAPLAGADKALTNQMKALTFDYLEGKADQSLFANGTGALFTPAQIARTKTDIKVAREDASFDLVHQRRENHQDIFVYSFAGEKRRGPYVVSFTINPDGKIADMIFQSGD